MNRNNHLLFLPRMVFFIYIMVTMFLFLFGPIQYKYIGVKEVTICCGYILVFLLFAVNAYSIGIKKKIRIKKYVLYFRTKRIETSTIVKFSIIYSVLIYILLIFENISVHGNISFNGLNYYSAMAQSYTDIEYNITFAGRMISYTSIFKVIAIVGGVYYWKEFKNFFKISIILLFVLIITNNIFFVGSQKQIIDLFIYVIITFVANHIQSGNKLNGKTKIIVSIAVVFAIIIMGNVIAARVDLWETRYNAVSAGLPLASSFRTNSMFYKILPKEISLPIIFLSGYFTQGYRGLALCLSEPFVPTWGMGFSFKIMNDFAQWFNIPLNVIEKSYPIRMGTHYGIDAYSNWHTIFPWFASDVSFFGALIVVAFFIYLWAKTWKEWLEGKNMWALLLFAHLTIFVLYIPCNNQLFQTRESILSTILIYVIWKLFGGVTKESAK